ncbi:cytochrome P450 [Sphingosinicella rhizophila]|uniref:Cytochrome P450 n=1 Tax=Sphingosinicella rhizophila TaxID=3050082 RepID=A0ABU3Q4C5_9SPHN|nr:cytochrome P450 [Sphingosinicella sp. GR2756]MDT9598127.1 cytochrome P450 [Sphingosinicella sp. GR2756]
MSRSIPLPPAFHEDPFAEDMLIDPYPLHHRLREIGPAVWIDKYDVVGVARYQEVRQVLIDWRTFSSARGVGLADLSKERFRLKSLILETDPPVHNISRSILMKVLSPAVMAGLKSSFEQVADRLIDTLAGQDETDGVRDIAEAYPLSVFPAALGMKEEGRGELLPYSDMLFNSFGPDNDLFRRSAAHADAGFAWVKEQSLRPSLAPGGFGAAVYEAADAGIIGEEEAAALVRAMLAAGVDTTVSGIGAVLHCLARFPDQWRALRADPGLANAAFEEAIRFETPAQTFFRTTTGPARIGDHELEEGQKVLMFLGAANRDPRRWEDPDRFDIQRKAGGHVGFGVGIHMCVGQLLAKLEAGAIITALLRHVKEIELLAPAAIRPNNTLRTLAELKLRLVRA